MSGLLQSLLGRSAWRRLQEIDRRGSRFTELLRTHRGDEAVTELLGILDYAPDWTQIHFEIVDYAVKHERLADRLYGPLQEAIARRPGDARLRYAMGLLMQAIGDQDSAKSEYREAIRLREDFAVAYHNLAVAHNLDDPEAAIELFSTAIRLNPRLAEAHFALAAVLMRLGRREQAIDHFRAFVPLAYPHLEAFKRQALVEVSAAERSG